MAWGDIDTSKGGGGPPTLTGCITEKEELPLDIDQAYIDFHSIRSFIPSFIHSFIPHGKPTNYELEVNSRG